MPEVKRYPNRLGIKGWLFGGKWGPERYLYFLHRVTGLGLLFYFLIHILVVSSRSFGQEQWEGAMARVTGGLFTVGEFLVFVAFAFHALNGIRLVLIELGVLTGKAEDPVFPYRSSVNVQRPFMIVMMILAAILILVGGYDFFVLAAH
jgi:succinate dehydrogenase / fumarate reductase cytochrome b subunit